MASGPRFSPRKAILAGPVEAALIAGAGALIGAGVLLLGRAQDGVGVGLVTGGALIGVLVGANHQWRFDDDEVPEVDWGRSRARHHHRRGRSMVPSTVLAPLDRPARPQPVRATPPAGDLVLRVRRPLVQQVVIWGLVAFLSGAFYELWREPALVVAPICVAVLIRAATDRVDVTTTAVVVRDLLGTDTVALAEVATVFPDPSGRHPRGFYLERTDGSQLSLPSVRAGSGTGQRRTCELLEATIGRLR